MERRKTLLLMLLEETLHTQGKNFYTRNSAGDLENNNRNTLEEIITEDIANEFYAVIEDKLRDTLLKKYRNITEEKLLNFLRLNPEATSKDISREFGVLNRTAKIFIERLLNSGKIIKTEEGAWKVVKNN